MKTYVPKTWAQMFIAAFIFISDNNKKVEKAQMLIK